MKLSNIKKVPDKALWNESVIVQVLRNVQHNSTPTNSAAVFNNEYGDSCDVWSLGVILVRFLAMTLSEFDMFLSEFTCLFLQFILPYFFTWRL